MRLPWQLGYAIIGAALAADCLLIACAAHDEQRRPCTEAFPDVPETPDIGGAPVIVWQDVVDRRPFLLRVLASLRPWGEAGSRHASVRVSADDAELSGEWRDNEKIESSHLIPQRYAIGITGGAEF